uniref:Spermine synthase n=1 Tax=Magallana gigas TaxID=29159 RepID=K1R5T1_MAGGI
MEEKEDTFAEETDPSDKKPKIPVFGNRVSSTSEMNGSTNRSFSNTSFPFSNSSSPTEMDPQSSDMEIQIYSNSSSSGYSDSFTSESMQMKLREDVVDGKDNCIPLTNGPITLSLMEAKLWYKFLEVGTEMIINRTGSLSVPIRRGPGITWTFGQTGDERLFETDYEEIVFEADSKWQNIKIAKSREFGNVLLLDNDIMLGESDLVYTETLLGLGRNEFKDKTILILGGGDGGILHEILKMSTAYVLMAEIDEEVIKACSKHMKKIKICDCILELKEAFTSGTKYDYVINDLTEFSVDKDKYEAHQSYKSLPNVCFKGNADLQTICNSGGSGDKMITATSDD